MSFNDKVIIKLELIESVCFTCIYICVIYVISIIIILPIKCSYSIVLLTLSYLLVNLHYTDIFSPLDT